MRPIASIRDVIALLSMVVTCLLANSPARAAQPQLSIFVATPDDKSSGDYPNEARVLTRLVGELERRLRAVSWTDLGLAKYKLRDVRLLDGGAGVLQLNAIFIYRDSREDVHGRSEPSENAVQRAETALADLLRQTIFDPEKGPYGLLRVVECTPPGADEEVYFLTVRPPAHVGLENGLAYELARAGEGGRRRPLRIFFHPHSVRRRADGATEIQFMPLQKGKAKPAEICRAVASSPVVLLVHYMVPGSAEGSSHGNARVP